MAVSARFGIESVHRVHDVEEAYALAASGAGLYPQDVISPKPPFEDTPVVSGRANTELQIFGIGSDAGHRTDAPDRE